MCLQKDLYVSRSMISGRGLFCRVNIPRGKPIFVMKGRTVSFKVSTKKDAMLFPSRVGIGKDTWMEPDMKFVKFINHSCEPTAGIRGRVTFVALCDIPAGEEITFDYSISEDSQWEMPCSCGAKSCRKIIKGVQNLPESIFNSYLPFIPKYFQKVYRKSKFSSRTKK